MKKNIFSALLYTIFLSIIYGSIFLLYYFIDKPSTNIGVFYSFIYSYGHGFEFSFFILIFALLTFMLPKYIKSIFWVLPAFLLLLYFIVDIAVFKQFRYNINFSMLQLFFGPASKEIFNFSTTMYIQFFFIVTILLIIIIFCYIVSQRLIDKIKYKYISITAGIMLSLVVLYHGIHAYAHHTNYIPVMRVAYILPQSYPLILKDVLNRYGIESANKMVENLEINKMNYPIVYPKTGDNATKYNIVYIAIESWRFDSMTEDVTPNIYNFAKNNINFLNHNANSNQTRHGIFSLFYGIPGSYWDEALYSGTSPVIMDKFQEEKYQLGIFASSSLKSPEFNRTVFSKVPNLRVETNAPNSNLRDVKITEEFIDFLDQRSKDTPFFGFLFYDTPHSYSFDSNVYPPKFKPYGGNKNYINQTESDRTEYFNLYLNSLGYTDILVGQVLDALKERNLLNNTIIIITGDHAEEFNDLKTNYWGHFGNYSQYQTHVPMILHMPNIQPKEVSYETSHMDVTPTIMIHAFDCADNKSNYTIGYDLLDNTTRPYIFIKGEEYAVKYKDGYIIMKKYGFPEHRDNDYKLSDEPIDNKLLSNVLSELKQYRK